MNGMRFGGIVLVLLLVAGGASAQSADSLAQWRRARCYAGTAIEAFAEIPGTVRLTGAAFFSSAPVPYGGKLYASTTAGKVLVINDTGIEQTLVPGGTEISDVAVSDKFIIVGSNANVVVAFDRALGKRLWKCKTKGRVREAALIVGERIVVASDDGKVTALDALGKPKWTYNLKGRPYAAAYDDSLVFAGSDQGGLAALNMMTGKPLWTTTAGGRTPCVAAGVLFVLNRNGVVIALDKKTGAELWRYDENVTPKCFALAVSDSALVYAADDTVTIFDPKTGKARWAAGFSRPICGSPMIVGNMVYVPCSDFKLHGFTTSFGVEMCNANIGFMPWGSPAFGDGKIYFPNKETMFVLKPKE